MKETLLEVLMSLFHSYLKDETTPPVDIDELLAKLETAGFSLPSTEETATEEIALDLTPTAEEEQDNGIKHFATPSAKAMRIYDPFECEKLSKECRGFLQYLEQLKIVSPKAREAIIDHVMELEGEAIELENFKWLVFLVLLEDSQKVDNAIWMESVIFQNNKTKGLLN